MSPEGLAGRLSTDKLCHGIVMHWHWSTLLASLSLSGWPYCSVWDLINVTHSLARQAGRRVINYQEVWEDFGDRPRPLLAEGSVVQVWSSVRRDDFVRFRNVIHDNTAMF
eukprot:SAG22_NODE_373_length_11549_cov_12.592052_3_plen_110_part_00